MDMKATGVGDVLRKMPHAGSSALLTTGNNRTGQRQNSLSSKTRQTT